MKLKKIHILLLGILLLAAALRFYHLSYKSISIDEAIGGLYASDTLPRVLILTINDVHPPLFYIIHHFWIKVFGTAEAGLRSIAVFFGLLSIAGLYKLGALIFNRRVGIIAAFLLAISPWHIWISQNARSNSLVLFLTICSIYSLYQLLRTQQHKWFVAFAAVSVISIYTHYFMFMVLIAQNIYVFLSPYARRWILQRWWYTQITIIGAYFLWLPFMISQFLTKTRPMYKELSAKFIKNLFDFLNPYAAIQKSWVIYLGEMLFIVLVCYALIQFYRQNISRVSFKGLPPQSDHFIAPKWVGTYLILAAIAMVLVGDYLGMPRSLPILEQEVRKNSEIIYADTVRNYHLEQLKSFPLSFYLSAGVGIVLFFCNSLYHLFKRKVFPLLTDINGMLKSDDASYFSRPMLLAIHLVLPLLLAGVISLKSPYLLLRNMIIAVPSYFLIIAFALSVIPRKHLLIGVTAVMVLFSAFSIRYFESWMVKDDFRTAAKIIKQGIKNQDVVISEHPFGNKPLYYYGVSPLKPMRKPELANYLQATHGNVWVLKSYQSKLDLSQLLQSHYKPITKWELEGSTNEDDLQPMAGKLELDFYHKKGDDGSFLSEDSPTQNWPKLYALKR